MEDYKKYEPFFGAWYITKLIGKGSFGRVYEISRKEFGMEYKAALKIISVPQDEDEVKARMTEGTGLESVSQYYAGILQEIVNENMLMSKLKGNSNIVSYEDHQIIPHEDGIGYDVLIRMELLTPLIDLMLQKKLSEQDVVKLGIDICKALDLCHRKNIIHRDIKPQNIFVSENGDFKLGDFGIARTMEKTSGNMSKKGTYKYMAPEVFRGDHYDSTADLYSLGIVLFSLMNGNRGPFLPPPPAAVTHTQEEDARMRRLRGEPIPAPQYAGTMLTFIIQKACDPDPQKRYRTAGQMKRDLENYLNNYEEKSAVASGAQAAQYAPKPQMTQAQQQFTPKQVTQNPAQYGPQRQTQNTAQGLTQGSVGAQRPPQSAPQKPAQTAPQRPVQGTAGTAQRPAQSAPQRGMQYTQQFAPVQPGAGMNTAAQAGGRAIPPGAYAGGAPAKKKPKKKKGKAGLAIVLTIVAVAAAALIYFSTSQPYLEPIDKLFRAYNTNNASLLKEAVSPYLYESWNIAAVTDDENDDSYEVIAVERMSGSDLENAKAAYGVTQCYFVTLDDKVYFPDDGSYVTFREDFIVGKLNGKWKVVDILATD